MKKIVFFISTYSFSHMFCKYTHTVKYFPWEFWGSLKRKLLTWAERSLVLSFTIWQNLLFHSFKNLFSFLPKISCWVNTLFHILKYTERQTDKYMREQRVEIKGEFELGARNSNMLYSCEKIVLHFYIAYCCSELKVRIPLYVHSLVIIILFV